MSIVKVTLPGGEIPVNGKQVSFVAPCACAVTDGLQIEGENYTIVDALCNCVTGKGGRWEVGAVVSVILDVDKKLAYLQNGNLAAEQVALAEATATALGLSAGASVDDALGKLSASALVGVEPTYLDSKKVGETISLNETVNGVSAPASFIILSKNYNNTGRALVARQTCDARFVGAFNSAGTGVYAGSTIDSFYTTYLGYLDADVQSQITDVDITVTTVDGTATTGTISRKVFALSTSELNFNKAVSDGVALPYYTEGGQRWFGGTTWTRTINSSSTTYTYTLYTSNNCDVALKNESWYYIPAFTLPLDFVIDKKLYFVDTHGKEINIGTKVEIGSYKGAGRVGSGNKNTLTFSFTPKMWGVYAFNTGGSIQPLPNLWVYGEGTTLRTFFTSNYNYCQNTVTYAGNSVSWYNSDSDQYQLNTSSFTYYYFAIG